MTTAGPNFPSTGASSGGTVAWTNPGNITSTNGAVASQNSSATATNNAFLNATGFGFAIPAGATINGITVTITRDRTGGALGNIVDNTVELLIAGVASGSNLASATSWPTTLTATTYGSATTLWGLTPTATDINNANFGVTLRCANSSGGNRTANVDSITVTITYTPVTPTPTPTLTPTISVTASLTLTPTPTLTPTLTPSVTATSTVTPTFTPTATVTPTITPTSSVTPSITASITPTITPTITATATVTPTLTRTTTPSPSVTPTISITPTNTPTITPTASSRLTLDNAFEAEAFSVDGNVLIMSGYADPTVTNPNAPVGSVYIKAGATGNPYLYIRTITGWQAVF